MKHTVRITDLTVVRGSTFRLTIPSLSSQPGSVLCIVGPNGSGKSTLIECITGLLTPLRGTITVQGQLINYNLQPTKASIGYIPDDDSWFIKELSAAEYFDLLEGIYQEAGISHDIRERRKALAQELHFSMFDIPLQQLSHGNKKKVQIIAALMHNPQLVVMDEIRNGLDPFAVIAIEDIMRRLSVMGVCIIATSHDLWWAERIATDVLLMVHGNAILHDSLPAVQKQYGHLETAFRELVEKST